MKVLLVTLALALSAGAQRVDITNTGNELITECAVAVRFMDTGANGNAAESFASGDCHGVVHGVSSVLQFSGELSIPDGTTGGQLIRIVEKYLQDHPEELNESDSKLVVKALTKAFPKK